MPKKLFAILASLGLAVSAYAGGSLFNFAVKAITFAPNITTFDFAYNVSSNCSFSQGSYQCNTASNSATGIDLKYASGISGLFNWTNITPDPAQPKVNNVLTITGHDKSGAALTPCQIILKPGLPASANITMLANGGCQVTSA